MNCAAADLERFRSVLGHKLGLAFEDGKLELLREVLERRAAKAKVAVPEYVRRLEHGGAALDELNALALELTVTETYFFRHTEQLQAFCDVVLGKREAGARPLRILSAGCASGEEAYSLAILTRERLGDAAANVSIVGIDVNARGLEKAARAKYTRWSLRQTPADAVQRWFRPDGNDFVVHDDIRQMVRFEQKNLVDDDLGFWHRDAFDVVLCRNVLMYFTPDATRAVTRRIAESLVPGGFFFLGHAETWRALARDFYLCQTHETFYYRRREALPVVSGPPFPFANDAALGLAQREDWFDVIRQSASRVTSLTEPPQGPTELTTTEARPASPSWDADRAATLIHEERISEAEDLLSAGTADSANNPDKLLLRAVLFTRAGDVVAAERTCEELIELDGMSAGARYLKALCRETSGDRAGATEQDLLAARADPGFSLPRLHLGLLARRQGDVAAARRQFAHALTLLEREEASRLLLFGGGFSREALIDMCRAELVACGRPS